MVAGAVSAHGTGRPSQTWSVLAGGRHSQSLTLRIVNTIVNSHQSCHIFLWPGHYSEQDLHKDLVMLAFMIFPVLHRE